MNRNEAKPNERNEPNCRSGSRGSAEEDGRSGFSKGSMAASKRPTVLIIRDGWGKNPFPEWNKANAVYLAKHPVADKLMAEYPNVLIHTSGFDVGLPENTMGNSEVGHQNIGAGRVVDQESVHITKEIRSGKFFDKPVLNA